MKRNRLDLNCGGVAVMSLKLLVLGLFVLVVGARSAAGEAGQTKSVQADKPGSGKIAIDPLDWPSWRGPELNGISRETGLIDRWDYEGGSNTLWKNEELGGISTPIVLGGKLYTIVRDQPGTPREGEKVICVNAETGKKIWESKFNVYL